MFPSLSRISEPLLGADQPTASSGPPRDKRSRGSRLVPRGGRPPEVIRIRVLTTVTAATPLQPHPRETAMSGTTTPVAPRRTSLPQRRHPKSLQEPSHSSRLIPAPRRAASGLIGLQTGARIHQRSLPGHTAHHHPRRKGSRRRRVKTDPLRRFKRDPSARAEATRLGYRSPCEERFPEFSPCALAAVLMGVFTFPLRHDDLLLGRSIWIGIRPGRCLPNL